MTKAAVLAFLESVADEPAFLAYLEEADEGEFVKLGRARGFEFSIEDAGTVVATLRRAASGELDEGELDAVVGGASASSAAMRLGETLRGAGVGERFSSAS